MTNEHGRRERMTPEEATKLRAHFKNEGIELPGMLDLQIAVAEGKWPHTMDGKIWAEKFMETLKENPQIIVDEELMLGWFCGAIMAGYDTAMHRVAMEDKK